MAVNLDVYDTLVHAIYDAALHPLRWPQVLERLCFAFDSCNALLFTPLHGPAQGGFTFTHRISTATVERWSAKSIHDDVYTQAALRRGLLVDGMAINSDDLVPRVEAYASRFYQELWAPAGLSHGCMGSFLLARMRVTCPRRSASIGARRRHRSRQTMWRCCERCWPICRDRWA